MAARPSITTNYLVGDDAVDSQMGGLQNPLNVKLHYRPNFAHVEVALEEGQQVVADAGALLFMDDSVEMNTSCALGGCCSGYWRRCSGESGCVNTFTGPGRVAFADTTMPGDCIPFALTRGQGWLVSNGSYLCCTPNVKVSGKWAGCCMCACGGEGAFLTHITLNEDDEEFKDQDVGVVYVADYGSFQAHTLQPGASFYVDNGLFLACSDNVKIEVAILGGCITCCCGGEGVVLKFTATLSPVTVYTQNRDPAIMKKLLKPPPAKQVDNKDDAAQAALG